MHDIMYNKNCFLVICYSLSLSLSLLISQTSGLMYSPLESLIGHYCGKKDIGNSLTAAAITGALFKSTGEILQYCNVNKSA